MQRLAESHVQDAADIGAHARAATEQLPRLGARGFHSANVNRDLERMVRRDNLCGGLEPSLVSAIGWSLDGGIIELELPCFLPHEIVAAVCRVDFAEFLRRFGAEDAAALRTYWLKVEGTEWFASHPHRDLIRENPQYHMRTMLVCKPIQAYLWRP